MGQMSLHTMRIINYSNVTPYVGRLEVQNVMYDGVFRSEMNLTNAGRCEFDRG